MSNRYRIAVVEDDDETRGLLVAFVRSTPLLELVGEYSSPEVALTALPHDQPDVVLMDINLPKMSGIECVRQLKPRMPQTQFLMLTVYADHDNIFAALTAGATGYLLKGTRREDLVAAIGQIMEGGSPMSSGIARKVVSSFVNAEATRNDLEKLSPKERSVLVLLTKGFLYKEIAESLSVSVPTVNTHIRHIYEKLQVQSRSQAIAKYFRQSS
jgi:DNA-binding NarL/FixJ family response regulator